MGCNCKGGQSRPQIDVSKSGQITDKEFTPIPTASLEDVIRVKDYLKSRTKTAEERQFFNDFIYNNFGEIIGSYCDVVCMERQVKRINELELKLLP